MVDPLPNSIFCNSFWLECRTHSSLEVSHAEPRFESSFQGIWCPDTAAHFSMHTMPIALFLLLLFCSQGVTVLFVCWPELKLVQVFCFQILCSLRATCIPPPRQYRQLQDGLFNFGLFENSNWNKDCWMGGIMQILNHKQPIKISTL